MQLISSYHISHDPIFHPIIAFGIWHFPDLRARLTLLSLFWLRIFPSTRALNLLSLLVVLSYMCCIACVDFRVWVDEKKSRWNTNIFSNLSFVQYERVKNGVRMKKLNEVGSYRVWEGEREYGKFQCWWISMTHSISLIWFEFIGSEEENKNLLSCEFFPFSMRIVDSTSEHRRLISIKFS